MATAQSVGRVLSVRRRRQKIATERKEHLRRAGMHRLNGMHSVQTVIARRLEVEFRTELVKEFIGRLFPNSHCAIALHIAVTANRTKARAGLAELATQHHQI